MDAATQLALMAKATHVFGSDANFLSFPVTPLGINKSKLDLLGDTSLLNLIEFSQLANLIPTGTAWLPNASTYLWDVYRSVLTYAVYAESSRTAGEEADYQAALDVLYDPGADGLRVQSARALAYKICRDRYIVAQEAYLARPNAAPGSSESTEDAELRTEMEEALREWESAGYRAEIESAEATEQHLGAKSPQRTRKEWLDRFNSDVDSLTRPSDQAIVYPTSYVPEDALDDSSWRPFTISGDEIASVLALAPKELRDRLGVPAAGSPIESLSFEFSSAALVRPWFTPDLFRSRFWRFPDSDMMLSDEQATDTGLCPAYSVALVFARNIQQRMKPNAPVGTGGKELRFNLAALPQMQIQLAQLKQSPTFRPRRPSAKAAVHRPMPPSLKPVPAFRINPAAPIARQRTMRLQQMRFRRMQPRPTNHPPVPVPSAPPVASVPANETIYILAFVCKRVGKSPNPDMSLHW